MPSVIGGHQDLAYYVDGMLYLWYHESYTILLTYIETVGFETYHTYYSTLNINGPLSLYFMV